MHIIVRDDVVSDTEQLLNLDTYSKLLVQLSHQSILNELHEFNTAARKTPISSFRRLLAEKKEYPILFQDHGTDPNSWDRVGHLCNLE